MTEQPKPRETKYVNANVIFEDSEGYYCNGEIVTEEWDNFQRRFKKTGSRIVKVRMSELGLEKTASQEIYIIKKISSSEQLSDEEVYFNCTLEWSFPDEARYKPYFWRVSKRSGEVFMVQLDSGVCSSAGINSEFVKRKNVKKCPPDTRIPKNATNVFVLNPSTNELERKLPEPYQVVNDTVELEDLAELQKQRIAEAKKRMLEAVDFMTSWEEAENRKRSATETEYQGDQK